MVTVFDVANFILKSRQDTTAWQLQKLCYYSKAWGLVLINNGIFDEPFEAWANGPVCRTLYYKHKGRHSIPRDFLTPYSKYSLAEEEESLVEAVLEQYGKMTGEELKELSHSEIPWKITRGELPDDVKCNKRIEDSIIKEYYSHQYDDLEKIDNIMLTRIADKRLSGDYETVSFEEMMSRFGITAEDLDDVEAEFEVEPIVF